MAFTITKGTINQTRGVAESRLIAFHGDADGVMAGALYLRKLGWKGIDVSLVSGNKFDMNAIAPINSYFEQVPPVLTSDRTPWSGPRAVTFLDLPFDKNEAAVQRVLDENVPVTYIDHHVATAKIPDSPLLTMHLDTSPDTSTAHIVFGMFPERSYMSAYYAAIGLAGDNRMKTVDALAKEYRFDDKDELIAAGKALNYNSFAEVIDPTWIAHTAFELMNRDLGERIFLLQVRSLVEARNDGLSAIRSRVEDLGSSGPIRFWSMPRDGASEELFADIAYERQDAEPDKYHLIFTPTGEQHIVALRGPERTDELARVLKGGGRATAAGARIGASIDDAIKSIEASEFYKSITAGTQ